MMARDLPAIVRDDLARAVQAGQSVAQIAQSVGVDRTTVCQAIADQVDASGRDATPDEVAGLAWWNGLSIAARTFWIGQTESGTAAEARAVFLARGGV